MAAFVGLANFLVGRVVALERAPDGGRGAVVEFGDCRALVAASAVPPVGSSVEVLVRPEHFQLELAEGPDGRVVRPGARRAGEPSPARAVWHGTVAAVSYLGSVARYQVAVPGQPLLTVDQHGPRGAALLATGTPVCLLLGADRAYLPADAEGAVAL